jgi:hypothetical protein
MLEDFYEIYAIGDGGYTGKVVHCDWQVFCDVTCRSVSLSLVN